MNKGLNLKGILHGVSRIWPIQNGHVACRQSAQQPQSHPLLVRTEVRIEPRQLTKEKNKIK
jgi:hypothetical protein